MNTLSIGKTEITLHGFGQNQETLYFIFRKNGLVITSEIQDITSHYVKTSVNNGVISDPFLRNTLIQKGYDSDFAFVEHGGAYYYTKT